MHLNTCIKPALTLAVLAFRKQTELVENNMAFGVRRKSWPKLCAMCGVSMHAIPAL